MSLWSLYSSHRQNPSFCFTEAFFLNSGTCTSFCLFLLCPNFQFPTPPGSVPSAHPSVFHLKQLLLQRPFLTLLGSLTLPGHPWHTALPPGGASPRLHKALLAYLFFLILCNVYSILSRSWFTKLLLVLHIKVIQLYKYKWFNFLTLSSCYATSEERACALPYFSLCTCCLA